MATVTIPNNETYQVIEPEKTTTNQVVSPPGKDFDAAETSAAETSNAQSTTANNSNYTYSPTTGVNSTENDGLLDSPIAYGRDESARPSNDWQNVSVDSGGLIDNAVTDINKLTNENNPLMQQAGTKAAQAANSRGLLNSTMAVTAGQESALSAVMPLVQQRMQTDASGLLNNQQGNINAQLQDLNVENQAYLTAVDQAFNTFMESNKNAMSFYQTMSEQIGAVLQNSGLTAEEKENALYELQQMTSAGLNFSGSLYNADFGGGGSGSSGGGTSTGGTSNYPGTSGSSGGNYPGAIPDANQKTPEQIFGKSYLQTYANGSVLVDYGNFNEAESNRMRLAESVADGLLRWDEKNGYYVYAKDATKIFGGYQAYKAGQKFEGFSITMTGSTSADADRQVKADQEKYSTGTGMISPDVMREYQNIQDRGVNVKVDYRANVETPWSS